MQSGREDTLEERYAIKFCFKLGKYATETYGMLQTAFGPSCMNRASVFEWQKREDILEERYVIKFCFKLGKNDRNVWNASDCFWTILMNEHQFLSGIKNSYSRKWNTPY